jgi:hypothetical protein
VADPVLIHVRNAQAAGERRNVRPADILGILSVEGGTSATGKPVAPGDRAGPPSFGQFTFGTGASLKVRYGDSASETDAIARYLNQLGYQSDRKRAIAAYNGGPGNPQFDYADKVIAAAKRYTGLNPKGDPSPAAATPDDGQEDGRLIDEKKRSGAVTALLWVTLVGAGTVLFGLGASRSFGLRASSGATA